MAFDFSQSDGWVLHAVALAAGDGVASLAAIVAAGDVSNHAVFVPAELSDCLGRLLSAGLIGRKGSEYAPSAEVRNQLGKGALSKQRRLADRLTERASVRSLLPSSVAPTEAESSDAIEVYLRLVEGLADRAM